MKRLMSPILEKVQLLNSELGEHSMEEDVFAALSTVLTPVEEAVFLAFYTGESCEVIQTILQGVL